jgi:colicin import membrane protein
MASKIATLKSLVDWRQPGVLLSAVGHVALLVAGVVAFSTNKPFTPATEASPVDVISEQQFNEMTKGEKKCEKLPEPKTRADRIAEIQKQNDPGEAKKDVPAEPAKSEPPKAEAPKPEPEPPKVAAVIPPVRPPELRPVRTPLPTPPVKPEEAEEEEDEKAELPKRQPPKPEPKPEPKEDLTKILEEQKRIEEQKKAEEKAVAEAKKAEAEKKAREEREKRLKEQAEAKKLEDSIRQRLLTSREAPSSSGATAAQTSRQASLGTETATGKKLSPSERSQLVGLLTDQMNRCLNIPPGAMPRSTPIISIQLSRDGAIIGGPTLTNPKNEAGYTPFAEANMRALRGCAPYRIPARFMDTYNDWKNLSIGVIPPNG